MRILEIALIVFLGLTIGSFGSVAFVYASHIKSKLLCGCVRAAIAVSVFVPALVAQTNVAAWAWSALAGLLVGIFTLALVSVAD